MYENRNLCIEIGSTKYERERDLNFNVNVIYSYEVWNLIVIVELPQLNNYEPDIHK